MDHGWYHFTSHFVNFLEARIIMRKIRRFLGWITQSPLDAVAPLSLIGNRISCKNTRTTSLPASCSDWNGHRQYCSRVFLLFFFSFFFRFACSSFTDNFAEVAIFDFSSFPPVDIFQSAPSFFVHMLHPDAYFLLHWFPLCFTTLCYFSILVCSYKFEIVMKTKRRETKEKRKFCFGCASSQTIAHTHTNIFWSVCT